MLNAQCNIKPRYLVWLSRQQQKQQPGSAYTSVSYLTRAPFAQPADCTSRLIADPSNRIHNTMNSSPQNLVFLLLAILSTLPHSTTPTRSLSLPEYIFRIHYSPNVTVQCKFRKLNLWFKSNAEQSMVKCCGAFFIHDCIKQYCDPKPKEGYDPLSCQEHRNGNLTEQLLDKYCYAENLTDQDLVCKATKVITIEDEIHEWILAGLKILLLMVTFFGALWILVQMLLYSMALERLYRLVYGEPSVPNRK